MSIKIILTEDGSHSLMDENINETYHSIRGAKGESMHVYIREGLEYFLTNHHLEEVRILEIGLGTGLNVFLTAQFAEQISQKIHFTSLEPFPIEKKIYENLNYHQTEKDKHVILKIHESNYGEEHTLTQYVKFHKSISKLKSFSATQHFHIIYFDAFAPSKQPEIWCVENLKKCYSFLEPEGILTTYCAQGNFKRNLAMTGFMVETLKGAMGKKEMVRGIKKPPLL